jgi:heme-degrading monooxygenase HmoA
MVLEQAIFTVPPENTEAFTVAIIQACALFSSVPGHVRHEIHWGIEKSGTCLLLVWWETLEAHTVEFRQSPMFAEWRALVKPHYTESPQVLHFQPLH